jgi:hypothetical protein
MWWKELCVPELHIRHLQETNKEGFTDSNCFLGGALEGPDDRYGNGEDEKIIENANGRQNDTEKASCHSAVVCCGCDRPRLSRSRRKDDRKANYLCETLSKVGGGGNVGKDPGLLKDPKDVKIED